MRNIKATGTIYGETITLKQVSKVAARKAFVNGETVYLQSSNMYPFGVWQSVSPITLDREMLKADIDINNFSIDLYSQQVNECLNSSEDWRKNLLAEYERKVNEYKAKVINEGTQFDSFVSHYSFYNCDSERGKYVTFYLKIS